MRVFARILLHADPQAWLVFDFAKVPIPCARLSVMPSAVAAIYARCHVDASVLQDGSRVIISFISAFALGLLRYFAT